MTATWGDKDTQEYERIKNAKRKLGVSSFQAKVIAARTVSRRRQRTRAHGGRQTGETAFPAPRLEDLSKQELYALAREHNIENRSQMSKEELIQALRG